MTIYSTTVSIDQIEKRLEEICRQSDGIIDVNEILSLLHDLGNKRATEFGNWDLVSSSALLKRIQLLSTWGNVHTIPLIPHDENKFRIIAEKGLGVLRSIITIDFLKCTQGYFPEVAEAILRLINHSETTEFNGEWEKKLGDFFDLVYKGVRPTFDTTLLYFDCKTTPLMALFKHKRRHEIQALLFKTMIRFDKMDIFLDKSEFDALPILSAVALDGLGYPAKTKKFDDLKAVLAARCSHGVEPVRWKAAVVAFSLEAAQKDIERQIAFAVDASAVASGG